jgi:hypothetical protein
LRKLKRSSLAAPWRWTKGCACRCLQRVRNDKIHTSSCRRG